MKTNALILCGLLSVATWLPAATPTPLEQFQQALFDEEASRDLPTAIAGYEAVIKRLDEQRELAATAVFRLGESYRKLGKTNEAVAAYERIIREFADQETLVKLSEQNLGVLRPAPPAGATGRGAFQQRLRELVTNASNGGVELDWPENAIQYPSPTAERKSLRVFLEAIKGLEPGSDAELAVIMASQPNARLSAELTQVDQAHRSLNEFQSQFGSDHPAVKTSRSNLLLLQESVRKQRDAIVAAAEARLAALDRLAAAEVSFQTSGSPSQIDPAARAKQKELLEQELALLARQLTDEKKQVEVGTRAAEELIPRQREILRLERQLAALEPTQDSINRQRAILGTELGLVDQLIEVAKARHELGRGTESEVQNLQRDRLQLERDLVTLEQQPEQVASAASAATMTAEEAEELRRVQALVANSPDLINKPGQGPPLHKAIERGHLNVVRYLIANGASLSATDGGGRTPLYLAAQQGQLSALQLLLEAGVPIDEPMGNGLTAMHGATFAGNDSVVAFLLAKGANPDAKTQEGITPLHQAAARGLTNTMTLLIEGGANLEIWAERQQRNNTRGGQIGFDGTPLVTAVAHQEAKAVALLLERGANVNPSTTQGSPLLLAIRLQNIEMANRLLLAGADTKSEPLIQVAMGELPEAILPLLEAGADPNLRPAESEPPLMAAVEKYLNQWGGEQRTQVVGSIVGVPQRQPLPPTAVTPGSVVGRSGFQNRLATMRQAGDLDWESVVRALVKHGAEVNATIGSQSVLTRLCQSNGDSPMDMIRWLLEQGADPNVGGGYGPNRSYWVSPALHAAVTAENLDLIRLLIKHGARLDGGDSWGGSSPLHFAAADAHLEVVKLLLEQGAAVDIKNGEGRTPLCSLLKRWLDRDDAPGGRSDGLTGPFGKVGDLRNSNTVETRAQREQDILATIELLLKAGAKLDGELADGFPPLHFAAIMEDTRVLELLLAKGANANQATKSGVTALHVAAGGNQPGAIQVLAKAGADLNRADENGNTPLHYATIAKRVGAAEKLVQLGASTAATNEHGATPAQSLAAAPMHYVHTSSGRFSVVKDVDATKTIQEVLGR